MSRAITMLSGLMTGELTLTKRGANNRRFAVTKGRGPMDPVMLQALISTPAEGEESFLKSLKDQGVVDEDRVGAAVASFRMQKGMKDLVDAKTMSAVSKAAGYEPSAPAKADVKADAKAAPAPAKKSVDLSKLDDESRAMVESVFKSHEAAAAKAGELERVVKSLSDTVTALQDERASQTFVAKAAKDYAHLPVPDADLGVMLKSAHAVSPEFAQGFEALLGKMDAMVKSSALMSTVGANARAKSGDAFAKIEALADGMVQKSATSAQPITKAQAIGIVLKTEQGAALYHEYLGQNPKQRAEFGY